LCSQVQEFFGDFVVMDPQHFCIPLPRSHVVLQPFSWDYANSTDAVTRMTEGLASLTLSLRRRFNIRSDFLALPQHSHGPAPLKTSSVKRLIWWFQLHECCAIYIFEAKETLGKSAEKFPRNKSESIRCIAVMKLELPTQNLDHCCVRFSNKQLA